MLCATWNVNSLRARLPRVEEFLQSYSPSVLLLQETKCSPEQFPHSELEAVGYSSLDLSGGRWCGVAVLTPTETAAAIKISDGLPGEPNPDEARWIEARLPDGTTFVSVYAPNGRELNSPHFDAKLAFFKAAAKRVAELSGEGPLVVGGDMNVAPADSDVWDVTRFIGGTHVTAAERTALAEMRDAGGLVDAHCSALGDEQLFTWWDYRGGSFHRGFGMRIDHFLVSPVIAERIDAFGIAREFRKGTKPSDHAPVLMRLAD